MNFLNTQKTTTPSKNKFKKTQQIIDISSPTLFPELLFSSNFCKKEITDLNFLEATTVINDEKHSNEPWEVKPGWVYLTKNIKDNTTVWNPQLKEEQDKSGDNYQKFFSQMTLNWEKYKKQYEEINGDGSYDATYGVYEVEDYGEEFFDE